MEQHFFGINTKKYKKEWSALQKTKTTVELQFNELADNLATVSGVCVIIKKFIYVWNLTNAPATTVIIFSLASLYLYILQTYLQH